VLEVARLQAVEQRAERLVVDEQRDFEVQPQAARVEVVRAGHRDVLVDDDRLRVQQAAAVEQDAHAGVEQVVVVGAARVAHEKRVHLLGHDQQHVDAARRRGAQRAQRRVVGHEVRRRDHDAARAVLPAGRAALGGALQRARDAGRIRAGEDPFLQHECPAGLRDPL
jgi:hypothetical protein